MTKLFRNLSIAAALVILAACAATTIPAVGGWDISFDTPLGTLNATLDIAADGTGSMSSAELGEAVPITGITFDGNAVAFMIDVDAGGQSITLDFSGSVEGDALTGAFGSDFGEFAVTGTRTE